MVKISGVRVTCSSFSQLRLYGASLTSGVVNTRSLNSRRNNRQTISGIVFSSRLDPCSFTKPKWKGNVKDAVGVLFSDFSASEVDF